MLIKELIDKPDQIVLLTRPRRFGKTLNMSMLKYFFENPECRQFEGENNDVSYLFEGLNIFEDEKYKGHQGKNPLVYLSFKDAKQDNWDSTYRNLTEIIGDEYRQHENFHHGFMLGLLMYATNRYEVYSNREQGESGTERRYSGVYGIGRPDIALIPKDKDNTGYVFEFKWDSTKGSKTLDQLVTSAEKQILKYKILLEYFCIVVNMILLHRKL